MHKLFLQEKDNLELADGQYKWVAEGIEQRMLDRWKARKGGVRSAVPGQKEKAL